VAITGARLPERAQPAQTLQRAAEVDVDFDNIRISHKREPSKRRVQ
jgi:hypothetical protein